MGKIDRTKYTSYTMRKIPRNIWAWVRSQALVEGITVERYVLNVLAAKMRAKGGK